MMEKEKLYSPLNFYLRDRGNEDYDDINYWRDDLSHHDAFTNMDEINEFLASDRKTYSGDRGLAEYLGDGPLDDKVHSLVPHVELHGDKLWMVAHVELNEPLEPLEMANLKSWWGGQLSDGWGEGLEQREIIVDEGALYIEPWTSLSGFFIATQTEFGMRMGLPHLSGDENLPELHPDDLIDNMESELFTRLDMNLSDYCESLLETGKRELIGMADEIATRFAVRDYLKNDHKFNAVELNFLLEYRNPLEVVCEHTPDISTLLVMSGAISQLANLDGALRRNYQRAEESTAIFDSVDARDTKLTEIAQKHSRVETLETRKRDRLDFHEVSVWGLKAALTAAFAAGAAHQLAQEKSQTVSETIPPEQDGPSQRDILFSRLEKNLADMIGDLRSDITSPGISQKNIVELADRITSVSAAYDYISNDYTLDTDQVEYLLQFQNPLEVIADAWPQDWSGLMDMSYLVDDIFDKKDALQGDYPLMADAVAKPEVPPQEQPATGKPSLLAGLREAKAKAERPPIDQPPTKTTEPEL